jgi:hypothetical protein
VVGDPKDSRRFYFGAVNGGVWRTDDAGRTWQPLFEDVDIGSIGAIAVAPSAPNIIYVGTGEADMRSDIAQGIGMFRSADGGKSWSAIGLSDTQQIAQISVDPRNPTASWSRRSVIPTGRTRSGACFAPPTAAGTGRRLSTRTPTRARSTSLSSRAIGGQRLRQPLEIVADPRIRVTQADFDAQFRLARQIEQSRARVRNLLKETSAFEDKLKGNAAAHDLVVKLTR